MRTHNHRSAGFLNGAQELHNLITRLMVEVSGRFVSKDNLGRVKERTRNHDTLLLTSGELMRHLIGFISHSHLLQHLMDMFNHHVLIFPSGSLQYKEQVILNRAVSKQLKILKNDTNLTPQIGQLLALEMGKVIFEETRFAGSNRQFAIEGLHQCRFTTAYPTEQIHHLPRIDIKSHITEHNMLSLMHIYVFISD